MKTEIRHIKVECQHSADLYRRLTLDQWLVMDNPMGNGSDDAKLTGGTWLFKGNEPDARAMQAKRWQEVKAWSDSYYSRPWV
jgi:hypothetical protein